MKRYASLLVLLSALVFISLVYLALFTNAKMESGAMEPAVAAGDYLLVLRPGRPVRGDIVLVKKEREDSETIVAALRVVGLPGEVVSIIEKGVWIDGERFPEDYVTFTDDCVYPEGLSARDNMAAVVVPEDGLFVMADRRDTATDSRFFGTVSRDEVVGRVVFVYW